MSQDGSIKDLAQKGLIKYSARNHWLRVKNIWFDSKLCDLFLVENLFLPKLSKVHFSIWFRFIWQAKALIPSNFLLQTKHHKECNIVLYSHSGCLYRKWRFWAPSDSYVKLHISQRCSTPEDFDEFSSIESSSFESDSGFGSGFFVDSDFRGFLGVFSMTFCSFSSYER